MPEGKTFLDTLSDRDLLETIYQSQIVLSQKLTQIEQKTDILLRESKWFTHANPALTGDHPLFPYKYDTDFIDSWSIEIFDLENSVKEVRQAMNEED